MSLIAQKSATSIKDLNSYSSEEFRNKFLPHHTRTGWLYLTKPEKQVTGPDDSDRHSIDDCVHVVNLHSEDPDGNKPSEDVGKKSMTHSQNSHKSPMVVLETSNEYILRFTTSAMIEMSDLNACLDLIALTSSADYKASSMGWSPAKKKAEMLLDDMKYLLWSKKEDSMPSLPTSRVEGFLSFMLTYEDHIPVVYCYEIHLKPILQGRRIGRMLMETMENVGRQAGVRKAMLTVFTSNKAARVCYKRMGVRHNYSSPELVQL